MVLLTVGDEEDGDEEDGDEEDGDEVPIMIPPHSLVWRGCFIQLMMMVGDDAEESPQCWCNGEEGREEEKG